MLIKILGSGCAKCNRLEQLTREAVGELGAGGEAVEEHFGVDLVVLGDAVAQLDQLVGAAAFTAVLIANTLSMGPVA